jgi:hypothetical protein
VLFKGQGMTFSEVRPYQFGDEIRRIDWNKTARFREPFVKVMEEESELTMMLVVIFLLRWITEQKSAEKRICCRNCSKFRFFSSRK